MLNYTKNRCNFKNGGNKTHGSSDTSSGICHIAQNPPADGGKAHFVCLKGRRTLEPVAGNIQAQRRRRAADFIFDGNVIAGNYAITEFLEEVNPDVRLIGGDARQKAEIRRLTEWFDLKFEREVGRSLINEKVFKRFGKGLAPDSKVLKTALNNLNFHMEYIDWLCESRNYLAGSSFSLADVAAAAHLSIIDYLGDVPWEGYKNARLWYSKIKSRPAFKDILKDNIKGILPAKHYANLDF